MSVKLRKRKLKDGRYSLYLAIWNPHFRYLAKRGKRSGEKIKEEYKTGKWEYEFLNLHLENNANENKENLKLAENIRSKRHLEISSSEHGFIPSFKRKADFVEYFEKLIDKKDKSKKTWKNTLCHLKKYTRGSISFSEITKKWLEDFRDYLKLKVADNTARNYFITIKTALNHAVSENILLSSPARDVEGIKKEDTERTYLTLEELERLAKTPCKKSEIKKAFFFACNTGLRISDIRNLTWDKISREKINDHIDYKIKFRQKKTGNFEYMILNENVIDLLQLHSVDFQKLSVEKVFNLPAKTRLDVVLKDWIKKANILRSISFHISRHTFATQLLARGGDIYILSKLLGHKSLETTGIYTKIIDEKKKETVNLLPKMKVNFP